MSDNLPERCFCSKCLHHFDILGLARTLYASGASASTDPSEILVQALGDRFRKGATINEAPCPTCKQAMVLE